MNKLLLFLLLLPLVSTAQNEYIVYLKDKSGSELVNLNSRSLQRREKNKVLMNEQDLAVSQQYIAAIEEDCEVKGVSRWLNAIYVTSELSTEQLSSNHSFVRSITPINSKLESVIRKDVLGLEMKSIDYNVADTQIRLNAIDCLHDNGYTGNGVYLAIIDAGFKGMDTISYFDSTFLNGRVLDQYDFVNGLNVFDYSAHGTAVSSCVFGYKQNAGLMNYSGGAPMVDVALYVSEDVFSESLLEEFNLVQALERCDQQGVEIANISLGYTVFDNSSEDHPYSDMDGNTTIAAIGVNTAVTKGIIVVAAAGNLGPSTISTPCDADSCLCVAAVDNLGNYAPFSSVGPSADGQVKPDVAATGWRTWIVNDAGELVTGSGTSFASPMLCGGVACLIEAHPTMSAYQITQAVRQSGHQSSTPDNLLGFGIANMCDADQSLTLQSASLNELEDVIKVYPNPAKNKITVKGLKETSEVRIVDASGSIVWESFIDQNELIDLSTIAPGSYQLLVGTYAVPFIKLPQ